MTKLKREWMLLMTLLVLSLLTFVGVAFVAAT